MFTVLCLYTKTVVAYLKLKEVPSFRFNFPAGDDQSGRPAGIGNSIVYQISENALE